MDGLLEAVGVGGVHDLVVGVEQVALAVGLVDVAEDPSVPAVIGELHARELRIQIGDVDQARRVGPLAAQGRAVGLAPVQLVSPATWFRPSSESAGSDSRVFWMFSHTGSMRFSVPSPRGLSRLSGFPGGSSRLGRPISICFSWPLSKMRRMLPGWPTSKRGSGSR